MNYRKNIISTGVLFLIVIATSVVCAQSTVPRDTSFTVHQTYFKSKKQFPQIEIVRQELPPGVIGYENVVYSTIPDSPYGKRELMANVYRKDDQKKYLALLLVHGGGWDSGDRSLQAPLAQHIASRGYVTIPVEYRLIPEALYPAGLHDLKAAVRWVRANADNMGLIQHV